MVNRLLSMQFKPDFWNVDIARAAVQGISANCFGKDTDRASDITLAVVEAMNNVVEHTNSTLVNLEVAWNEIELIISIINSGIPFDPLTAFAGVSEDDMLERDEGGYGLFLIHELVDRFEYEYSDSKNVWKLTKIVKKDI